MKKPFLGITLIIVLGIIAGIGWFWKAGRGYPQIRKEVLVFTNQTAYSQGENPKIKIENKSKKTICFSSCYPYARAKINDTSYSYQYNSCPFPDVAEACVRPGEIKSFELFLYKIGVEKGAHRLAVPVCVGCSLKESFRKDKIFYSNEFVIK